MPNYMLLLYDGPGSEKDLSPEEMQQIIHKYQSWADNLRAFPRKGGAV